MSLLLHLSDLHLANVGHEDDVGDYSKTDAIREDDRVTRVKLVKSTLKALKNWLDKEGQKLDGIVITGDVTTRGSEEGFAALSEVLDALGAQLPSKAQVVVVPGNHDVSWGTEPGSAERYRHFIDGIRAHGYVTPLLDGIDYDGDRSTGKTVPLLVGDDFVVVAINSADMCGVIDPLPSALADTLDRLVEGGHLDADEAEGLRKLRMHDMPRIQPRQMDALADSLADLDEDGVSRVRIAALHHQLAPVREEEEVKPFESLVNLAAFTGFLAESAIDVVIHGHKHADHVQKVPLTHEEDARTALISSCGTIGGATGTNNEIAKLIRIESMGPRLRTVEISTVPAVSAGHSLNGKIKSVYRATTWRAPASTRITVVDGGSATDVHERLLALAADPGRPGRDLICVVDDGATAIGPPSTYIWPVDASSSLDTWFPETVEWWQDPTMGDGMPFTHGQRLRAWTSPGAGPIDQLGAIAELLIADAGSSRGVAVLVNPATDSIADKSVGFPSFSLLHLWIEGDQLHCSAFFRKQEMTYWWPVNVAEIATIQRDLIESMRGEHSSLRPGSIRTLASEPVFSDQLPKVDVPRIDRRFWRDEDSIRVLAVAVADLTAPKRSEDLADLINLLEDWEPEADEPPADGAPIPGPGLKAVIDSLAALAPRYPASPAQSVHDLLVDIQGLNEVYLQAREGSDPPTAYRRWRVRVRPKLAELRTVLASSAPPAPASPKSTPKKAPGRGR